MTTEIIALLLLGAGNGLLHALDADHILAVSAVALQGEMKKRKILRTALQWALGHGVSLLVITTLVVGFGLAVPERLSHFAELLVGIILGVVGLSLIWGLWKGEMKLSSHRHFSLPPHTHLHHHSHNRLGDHKSVLIGVVHGIAGSAPLLAVLPLVIRSEFLLAGGYILVFTLFVAVTMCIFGGLLGTVIQRVHRGYPRAVTVLQGLMAVQSLAFGGWWITRAI